MKKFKKKDKVDIEELIKKIERSHAEIELLHELIEKDGKKIQELNRRMEELL